MVKRAVASRYFRRESPTQTKEDAVQQEKTGEIWGRPARIGGAFPCVKAYLGSLPKGQRGIEFTTAVAPDPESSSPFEARWYYPKTPGAMKRTNSEGEVFAAIAAKVVNYQP
jgi:hypothetical protein